MQLEVKKETLKMEGVPTLWNVADLGTKRLSRQRREFLMYLIGLMEMQAEGREEFFTRVGEDAFNKEVERKVLAKKMKEVKNEMVQAVFTDDSSHDTKIPTNLVRAVTLMLLHREVRGEEASAARELPSGWTLFQIVAVYTMAVFAFGVYIGYRYRMKISICFRTCCRFLRQEVTMEFQREQDLRDQVGMIMRASMAAGIGEWHPDPEPRVYEPLLPQASRDEGEEADEANPETRMFDDPDGDGEADSEPEAENQPNWRNASNWTIEWTGSWLTDWNPELGRLQEYRILEHSDDAESGEEYFMSNPLGGYQRRYRPSQSERDEASPMEIDETEIDEQLRRSAERADERARGVWADPPGEMPPVDEDWWDYETLIRWLKPDEQPRARRLKEAGIFPNNQLKEFLRTRLTSIYGGRYSHMVFDHLLGWTQEEQRDFAAFSVAVITDKWDSDFDGFTRRYIETGEI